MQQDEASTQDNQSTKAKKQNNTQRLSPLNSTRRGTEEQAPNDRAQPQATEDEPILSSPVLFEFNDDEGIRGATIDVAEFDSCTVEEGATIAISDNDDTQGSLEDTVNAVITYDADANLIVVAPIGDAETIDVGASDGDGDFVGEDAPLVDAETGITCETAADPTDPEQPEEPGEGNDDCPGAKEVASLESETESQEESFFVTGDSFRINYDVTINDEFSSVAVRALDDDGQIDSELVFDTSEGDFVVLEGPGEFTLEVEVDGDAEYTATVEDCAGDGEDGGEDENGDGTPDDVVDDNEDDGNLPDTGGTSGSGLLARTLASIAGLGLVGLMLTGAGLLRRCLAASRG